MSRVLLIIAILIATSCALANTQRTIGWCQWSTCSTPCGRGVRTRACLCPITTRGLQSCQVGAQQIIPCGCSPVNGGWSAYGTWSACTVTCGGGIKTRTRTCTNPSPSCCGKPCVGRSNETVSCNPQICNPSFKPAPFAEALMKVDSTDTTRCNVRPTTCFPGQVCPKKCVDFCYYHDRDFLIMLDSSGSITVPKYEEAKVDLAILATHLCGHIGCDLRVAGMHFSTNPHFEFGFDEHTTPSALYSGIIGMGKEHQGTNTHLAFDLARLTMFTTINGHRPWAKKVALIVTDGRSNNGPAAILAAQQLKASGVEVFAVFIGNPASADYTEIRQYVSNPESLHVFSVASVLELGTLADYIESFHHKFCHCHCHCHCHHDCHYHGH